MSQKTTRELLRPLIFNQRTVRGFARVLDYFLQTKFHSFYTIPTETPHEQINYKFIFNNFTEIDMECKKRGIVMEKKQGTLMVGPANHPEKDEPRTGAYFIFTKKEYHVSQPA